MYFILVLFDFLVYSKCLILQCLVYCYRSVCTKYNGPIFIYGTSCGKQSLIKISLIQLTDKNLVWYRSDIEQAFPVVSVFIYSNQCLPIQTGSFDIHCLMFSFHSNYTFQVYSIFLFDSSLLFTRFAAGTAGLLWNCIGPIVSPIREAVSADSPHIIPLHTLQRGKINVSLPPALFPPLPHSLPIHG